MKDIQKEIMAVVDKIVGSKMEASADVVKTVNIQFKLVDFTDDEDEPAYDVNVYVDGKAVTGGDGVFSTERGETNAYRNADKFMKMLVKTLVRASGGRL